MKSLKEEMKKKGNKGVESGNVKKVVEEVKEEKKVVMSKDKLSKERIMEVYKFLSEGLKEGKEENEMCEKLFNEDWNVYRDKNYYKYYLGKIKKGENNFYMRELGLVDGELRKEMLSKKIENMKKELELLEKKEGDKKK